MRYRFFSEQMLWCAVDIWDYQITKSEKCNMTVRTFTLYMLYCYTYNIYFIVLIDFKYTHSFYTTYPSSPAQYDSSNKMSKLSTSVLYYYCTGLGARNMPEVCVSV